jgi:hypothetical protein
MVLRGSEGVGLGKAPLLAQHPVESLPGLLAELLAGLSTIVDIQLEKPAPACFGLPPLGAAFMGLGGHGENRGDAFEDTADITAFLAMELGEDFQALPMTGQGLGVVIETTINPCHVLPHPSHCLADLAMELAVPCQCQLKPRLGKFGLNDFSQDAPQLLCAPMAASAVAGMASGSA